MSTNDAAARESSLDSVLLAVIANRFETIVREMTNTMQRAAYSPLISISRDFSCSIVTGDNRLLASAEGLPVHIYGSHLQSEAMCELHRVQEGDAFLHNDPYLGNSHAADHAILVPVFVGDRHMFTTVVKGHLSDIGNALPTTYMPDAADVYEEGALVFPCVQVQRDYQDIDDIIRMCRSRIRIPEQWYGDYLAALGAARVGERRLKELVDKYSEDTILTAIEEWFDYSERRMIAAVQKLSSCHLVGEGRHDPFPRIPEGFSLRVEIDVDAEEGMIEIDLRDNIDCVPAGLNESVACAISSVVQATFMVLEPDIPHNAGTFRRLRVHLRDNCIVGSPKFPHSCSMATSDPAMRLINLTQSTFAQIGDGWGVAEGGLTQNAGFAIISGRDWRRDNEAFVHHLLLGNNGGPASPVCDGWVTYSLPNVVGLLYRDSVEIDEQKLPILVQSLELVPDSGGSGRFRGAPATRIVYGPRKEPIMVAFPAEGFETPPKGVQGGGPGSRGRAYRIDGNGQRTPLPNVFADRLLPGEWIEAFDGSGGGYGPALERDPKLVQYDVLEGWVSAEQAESTYGVVFAEYAPPVVDEQATDELRQRMRQASQDAEPAR